MKYDLRKILINIFSFYVMFYIFNISIVGRIFIKEGIATILLVISIGMLILLGKILKLRKYQLVVLIITFIAIIMELVNNFYLKEGRAGNVLKYTIMLFLPFIILINQQTKDNCFKVLKYFCLEHVFATFFVQIFKNVYLNIILPWISNGTHLMAQDNFLQGYNPGITSHYSMNGMYLSIAVIYFFSLFLSTKNKKNMFYTFLAILALLLTAKRAPLLFSVMSCFIMYFFYNKERTNSKILKGASLVFIGIIAILILSSFVPQILNVITRFQEAFSSGDLLHGREEFYELAKRLWDEKVLFGNGWGAFSYYFQEELYSVGYGVEYLDAHNVYLQLLCETGVVGFIFYFAIMFWTICTTIKIISKFKYKVEEEYYMYFSLGYQTFFLLYCFSGNPLYDIQCYALYFLCIGVTISNLIIGKNLSRKMDTNNEKRIDNIYTNL